MVIKSADRVQETSTTTGTGTIDLNGANGGFQTFVDGVGSGNTCYYAILDVSAWEVGEGTITSGSPDTLSRDIILASSSSGAILSLGAGTKQVFTTIPASQVDSIVRNNMVIGGNFDTNPWQREVTFDNLTTGITQIADNFVHEGVDSGSITIQQTADAPTTTQTGIKMINCLEGDVNGTGTGVLITSIKEIRYLMEGYDWSYLAENPFTISFWHKHTKTGIYCASLRNFGDDRSYVTEYTQDTTDVWEREIFFVPSAPTTGTWNYTNDRGLSIGFTLQSGSNFHGTVDTWNSSDVRATVNQVDAYDSTSNFVRFALVECTPGFGTPRTDWRTAGEVLALLKRYYEKSYDDGTYADGGGVGKITDFVQSTENILHGLPITYVRKRIIPVITSHGTVAGSDKIDVGGTTYTAVVVEKGLQNATIRTSGTSSEALSAIKSLHYTAEAGLI